MELKGKIINFLGDSITEGVGVADIENGRYDNVIKRKAELKSVNNYGISGTRLAHQYKPSDTPSFDLSFSGRSERLAKDADIIVVFGGTNDYGHGDAPFGELTDKTYGTFCGAVDYLMNNLKTSYPNSQIVFMTPARREGDLMVSNEPLKQIDAKPLKDYVDVIIEKGMEYSIPVLNLYDKLGIDPNNIADKEQYTVDGLHFNEAGHNKIADCLIDLLMSI